MEEFPKKRDLTGQEIQDAQEGLLRWHIEEQGKRIREQEEQIEHDFLTKLKTRHVLENELEKSLQFIRGEIPEQRGEALSELSLIAMDIDHFKDINDGLGHAAGDAVLKKVGETLLASVRKTDTVARWGGEELMVLMPGADIGTAARQAEELRVKIEEMNVDGYPELSVTASFGVVSSRSSTDKEELCRLADAAMYLAKEAGRNCVRVSMGQKLQEESV